MEWGNGVMDGPLTQGPAGREQVMSVTAKLRKISVSAVGKVERVQGICLQICLG